MCLNSEYHKLQLHKINTAQIVSDCSFVQYFSMCCPFSAITNHTRDQNPSMALLITAWGNASHS